MAAQAVLCPPNPFDAHLALPDLPQRAPHGIHAVPRINHAVRHLLLPWDDFGVVFESLLA